MQKQAKKKTLKVDYIKNSQFEKSIIPNLELREMRLSVKCKNILT